MHTLTIFFSRFGFHFIEIVKRKNRSIGYNNHDVYFAYHVVFLFAFVFSSRSCKIHLVFPFSVHLLLWNNDISFRSICKPLERSAGESGRQAYLWLLEIISQIITLMSLLDISRNATRENISQAVLPFIDKRVWKANGPSFNQNGHLPACEQRRTQSRKAIHPEVYCTTSSRWVRTNARQRKKLFWLNFKENKINVYALRGSGEKQPFVCGAETK